MVPANRVIPIVAADSSQIGYARRQALALAEQMEFSELHHGQLGIVVTEAARNIAAHAEKGEIVLAPWQFDREAGIDIFALDKGPGIRNLAQSLEDGYSTGGTPGQGLGAMSRLAGIFQVYSIPNHGTTVFARVYREPRDPQHPSRYNLGAINLPITGESVCGDAWSSVFSADRSLYIVADGLGHGPAAAEASQEAVRVFHESAHQTPERILTDIHHALTKTRGAAISIAEILHDKQVLNYVGAGNIAGAIGSTGKFRNLVSLNGTVGHIVPKFQQFSYPWHANALLVMHSDGLATRWNVEQYPGLLARHPALVAAVLYKDFSRRRDDVTVLVSRI